MASAISSSSLIDLRLHNFLRHGLCTSLYWYCRSFHSPVYCIQLSCQQTFFLDLYFVCSLHTRDWSSYFIGEVQFILYLYYVFIFILYFIIGQKKSCICSSTSFIPVSLSVPSHLSPFLLTATKISDSIFLNVILFI